MFFLVIYIFFITLLSGLTTRVVEYKNFTRYKNKNSLLGLEVPSLSNRLYPLPIQKAQNLADKYFDAMPEGVYSIGRAGVYRYGIDFDRCIDHAMIMARDIKSGAGGRGSILSIDPTGQQKEKMKDEILRNKTNK
jgi:UDP-galactopyranose mutase